MRRGTTRWWRLQVSGRDLTFVRLLDATHVLVRNIKSPGSPLTIIDLRPSAVDSPQVQQLPGGVTCVVPWTSSEATTSGYAWLRDGIVLRGATRSQRPRSRYDRGHSLTCRATARTPWGSVTLSSSNVYTVSGDAGRAAERRNRGLGRVVRTCTAARASTSPGCATRSSSRTVVCRTYTARGSGS